MPPKSAAAPRRKTRFSRDTCRADPEIAEAIGLELGRQRDEIEMIASETS